MRMAALTSSHAHDGLPSGVPMAANEAGWREALDKLAALVEAGENTREGAS